ncbi:MAG TPA: CehA/McbA family metallohydrolase [Ktedonosporobacter sp.]|nr:CehA/McbA family metallohydrolase [Ktedonosporobacter sp.]
MNEYTPIDLMAFHNAGLAILGERRAAPIGPQQFRGLPFLVGTNPEQCFVAFGEELQHAPLNIPIGESAWSVIVAHRLLASGISAGGPVGSPIADYVFTYQSGDQVRVTIRDRFEIAEIPTAWGQLPFRAVPDQSDSLPARDAGRFDEAGDRQTEVNQAAARGYYLLAWQNPRPEQALASLTVIPAGPRFLIAGVTVGHTNEYPFVRSGARPLKMTITDPAAATRTFDLAVEVDRGVTTFPYPLARQSPGDFLADPLAGWGEALNEQSSLASVEIAALPSATVTVTQGSDVLGTARWGEIEEKKVVELPRVRLELVDTGRNWVRTTVVDDETGQPVPCRVHFRSPDGIPAQPHGHQQRINSNMGTWHIDVGGDVRLGSMSYAYIDGTCQGWLPRGEVLVDVARGFEYEPIRTRVTITPGQQELTLRLKRWRNMNKERWFSGDTHVHFLSTQGSHTEAQGEDLNVVNLLLSQWGHLFTNTEEFTGGPSVSRDGRTIVYASQENRQHMLGHLSLLGLKQPVMPWCSDGPSEAEMGGTLEVTMSDWADRCHAQGGTVILPHLPNPNGEPAAMIATGRVDGVEFFRDGTERGMYNHTEYYRYLNGGYRLPLVGGTDKMSSDVPVGLYRTYVYIPPDQDFTHETWCANLAAGRTFMSGGPIISLSVDGHAIGDTVRLSGNGGTVEVEARAESIFPIHTLQIVQQGQVVAATEERAGTRRLELKTKIKVDRHTWLAARVSGPGYTNPILHHDVWSRGIMAHTSPIYVACGGDWWLFDQKVAQYMLTLIDGNLSYIRELSPRDQPGTVTHHHGEQDHEAYLERPFLEARAAIHQRMHELGLAH